MSKQNIQSHLLKSLTQTEMKIIVLISQNYSSKQIAETQNVSLRTIEKHRSNIIAKLNLSKDTNSLTKWALINKNLWA